MTVRYSRAPSERFLRVFQEGGLLNSLTHPLSCYVGGEKVWLDLQFRNADQAMLYCGQTRVLVVSLAGESIRVGAHPTYRNQPAGQFALHNWSLTQSGETFKQELSQYLSLIEIGPKWTRSEGRCRLAG